MGDGRVRQAGPARRPTEARSESEGAPDASEPEPPTPAEALDQASAALDAARERSGRRRRPRADQRLRLRAPRLQLPSSSPVQLAPELALRAPRARPEVCLEVPDPRGEATLEEAEAKRLMAQLEPPERERLQRALAAALADDAVDKLQALVDVVNGIRARRNERRERRGEEPREPLALNREAIREMLADGLEAGIEAGFKLALRAVLKAVVGEPVKSREELLAEPPEVGRLSPEERRLFVQLPPIPFG